MQLLTTIKRIFALSALFMLSFAAPASWAGSAAEIDKAMTNGGGSPFGPFALAKGMGWPKVAERCETVSKKLGVKWFLPTETLKKGNIQI